MNQVVPRNRATHALAGFPCPEGERLPQMAPSLEIFGKEKDDVQLGLERQSENLEAFSPAHRERRLQRVNGPDFGRPGGACGLRSKPPTLRIMTRRRSGRNQPYWFIPPADDIWLDCASCAPICGTITVISTRRFSLRPFREVFGATGAASP